MLARRIFLLCPAALACRPPMTSPPPDRAFERLQRFVRAQEGRIGVHALDTESGRRLGVNDDQRFAMASTFKLLLAAAILERCDDGEASLQEKISLSASDLVPHAPVTSRYVERGYLTLGELCEAIVVESDNPAANLLLTRLGGPAALTRFARSLGDQATRLDRVEPELNSNVPGDARDTTTPRAMVGSMERILVGNALSPDSRARLHHWLCASQTGLARIRAGLPATWRVGDKTGTGMNGAANDIAIAWPVGRGPLLIAVYMSGSARPLEELNAAHATIASLIASALIRASAHTHPQSTRSTR